MVVLTVASGHTFPGSSVASTPGVSLHLQLRARTHDVFRNLLECLVLGEQLLMFVHERG